MHVDELCCNSLTFQARCHRSRVFTNSERCCSFLLFFCSVRLTNWSLLVCKTAANSFTRNCTRFCESLVRCLNFFIFAYISVFLRTKQGGQRTVKWHIYSLQKATSLTASDRFPRTVITSVLVTPQVVLSVCAFPTSSMMPQIELIVNVISSSDLLLHELHLYAQLVCAEVTVPSYSQWRECF